MNLSTSQVKTVSSTTETNAAANRDAGSSDAIVATSTPD
jgi:hypothetical protein